MTRARFIAVVSAAVLSGVLAGCSSSGSGGSALSLNPFGTPTTGGAVATSAAGTSAAAASTAAGATSAADAASSPSTTTSSSPASPPASKVTIAKVLAKVSAGAITVKHMPTADPSWLARIQTEPSADDGDKTTDPQLLNLMALVDEAAREKDIKSLKRLCSECDMGKQLPFWQKPGALETLSTLLEQTHRTEGDLFPGFVLVGGADFQDPDSAADGKALGTSSPNDYVANHGGWATSFENGTGGMNPPPAHWNGLTQWGPYPS